MHRLLIVDTSALLHQSRFALSAVEMTANGEDTAVIYAFLIKLKYILNAVWPQNVVFAIDSRTSLRKEIFPEYKARRREKTEKQLEFDQKTYPQFDIVINEVLPTIGYTNIFEQEGYEADDIIASICRDYYKKYEIVIASNDNDLYQLLRPNIVIYNIAKNSYFTYLNYKKKYEIPVKYWKRVKVYGGCSSDGVPGIRIPDSTRNVGEKTAIKYLKGEIPEHYKVYKAFKHPMNKPIIKRNKKLVILPFKGVNSFDIKLTRLDRDGLVSVCKKYEFNSILRTIREWK